MSLFKAIVSCADGRKLIITFTQDQAFALFSEADYWGIKIGTKEFSGLVVQFARDGAANSVRLSNDSLEKIHTDLRRSYPDTLEIKEEDSHGL